MTKTELTGATRHRAQSRLFRAPLLVLQVQERTRGYAFDEPGGMAGGRDVDYARWRDATLEDIQDLHHRQMQENALEATRAAMHSMGHGK